MTSGRRHNRAPLRRSSAPEKVLASGLAAAACIGIVGVIGVRTMSSTATSEDVASSDESAPEAVAPVDTAAGLAADDVPVMSKDGLTREQLDAYAAALAAEKHRLDVYRVKLVQAAKKLQAATGTSTVSVTAVQAGTTDEVPTEAEVLTPGATEPTPAAAQPAAAQPVAAKPAPASGGGTSTTKSS